MAPTMLSQICLLTSTLPEQPGGLIGPRLPVIAQAAFAPETDASLKRSPTQSMLSTSPCLCKHRRALDECLRWCTAVTHERQQRGVSTAHAPLTVARKLIACRKPAYRGTPCRQRVCPCC